MIDAVASKPNVPAHYKVAKGTKGTTDVLNAGVEMADGSQAARLKEKSSA